MRMLRQHSTAPQPKDRHQRLLAVNECLSFNPRQCRFETMLARFSEHLNQRKAMPLAQPVKRDKTGRRTREGRQRTFNGGLLAKGFGFSAMTGACKVRLV